MLRCDFVYHEFPVCGSGKRTLFTVCFPSSLCVSGFWRLLPFVLHRGAVARISTVVTVEAILSLLYDLPPLAWGSEGKNCITGSVQSEKEVVPLHPSQHCTARSHERTADATGLGLFRLLAVFLVGGSVYPVASFYWCLLSHQKQDVALCS